MIVALDGTVLIVAQPSLQHDLGASVAQVQWTSTAYLLAVAALLVVAGRLGDIHGHRRLLLGGVLGFGAASAGIALAPGVGWVIALRAAQGVFGALLQPATLALLRLAYPPDRLGTPIAVRTSAIGIAAAAGPLLGGALVAHLGWRAVFVLNIPVALAIAALTLAVRVPTPPRTSGHGPGFTGPALLASGLALLVYTLVGVEAHGWGATPTLLGFLTVTVAGAALAVQQRRSAHPIVPPAVARSVPVTAAMALLLVTTAALFGTLFTATFLLQDVLDLDPLATGLRVLPMTALMVLGAPVAGAALRRHGARRTALTGSVLVVLGIAALSRLSTAASAAETGMGFALLGAGFTTVMVTATGTVVGDAPPGYAGVVGGLKQTAMNVGPTLGIAVAAGMPLLTSTGPTLLLLAGFAAVGLLPASLLPTGRPRALTPMTAGRRPEPASSPSGPGAGTANGR
ncbi:MFS transporter [Streptomyces sp. NPDC000229]|uniref:MFS transporter n=1 Tax=Streptomyces sp. NPDC000229 TaxID=3154247 RepID=UPI0033346700